MRINRSNRVVNHHPSDLKLALTKSTKGSSIIEVVTALTIISVSLSLTGVLFASVFNSHNRYLKSQAWFVVNEWVSDTRMTKEVEQEDKDYQLFVVTKKRKTIDADYGLVLITIQAIDLQGKELAMRNFYMHIEPKSMK